MFLTFSLETHTLSQFFFAPMPSTKTTQKYFKEVVMKSGEL